LKELVEKNVRWFLSNKGLQDEVLEYQKAVCAKDGQSAFKSSEDGRRMSMSPLGGKTTEDEPLGDLEDFYKNEL